MEEQIRIRKYQPALCPPCFEVSGKGLYTTEFRINDWTEPGAVFLETYSHDPEIGQKMFGRLLKDTAEEEALGQARRFAESHNPREIVEVLD